MLFFGVVLDGKNSFLLSQIGSDCHLYSCVHQWFDWRRGVRNLNGILIWETCHFTKAHVKQSISNKFISNF